MSKKVKYVSDNTLRYFLQKVKALISGKADKTPATNYANGLMSKEDYSKLHNLKKSDITDFPSTMPPSAHTHNDIYYTKDELNSKIEKDYEIVISNTQPPAIPGKTVLWIKTEITHSGGSN